MNKDIVLQKLYNLLLPALESKAKEFKTLGRIYIKEIDIWSYFKNNVWNHKDNLMLCDMISDIISTPNDIIDEYILNIRQKEGKENL